MVKYGLYFYNSIWYKNAIKHQSYPIFSPVYKDIFDKQDVITISISVANGKGVLALDLYLNNIEASWLPRTNIFDDEDFQFREISSKVINAKLEDLIVLIEETDNDNYFDFISTVLI